MSKHINIEEYKEKLYELYHVRRRTLKQIANHFGRDEKLIYRWLIRAGIKVRTSGESRRLLKSQAGSKNYHWKGFYIHKGGYRVVYDEDHRRVLEHRLVLKSKLKKGEVVHHVNGNKLDNRPENLMIMTQSEHIKEHARNDPKWGFRGYTKKQ